MRHREAITMKTNRLILALCLFVSLILSCVSEGTSEPTMSTSVQGQGVEGFDVVITCTYRPQSINTGKFYLWWFVDSDVKLGGCTHEDHSTGIQCNPQERNTSKYIFTADGVCCANITIKRLTKNDEKTYRCRAITKFGLGSSETSLTIIHPRLPDTHELTGTDNLQVNLSQEISCTSEGSYPAPTFRWYIDTREVTADAVTLSPETDGQGGRGEVVNATSILIYTPSRQDHGRTLVCSLSLRVSPTNLTVLNSSVILDIQYPPIIFTRKASAKWNGRERCTASLSCSSDANPPINHFRWVKVGAERVFNSSRTRHFIHAPGGLDDNERIGTLLIENVQASDYGSYQCIAYDEDRERNLKSAKLSLLKPSQLYQPNITAYPDRASASSIHVAWQPNRNDSMDGTGRVEYCPVNTSEEDCNTTTSASGANTTLTGLQSFTWYRLTLNFTNCSGTFSTQPLLASTARIRLEYDLQNETLKVLKSLENLTVPSEICFKPFKTLDPIDCSRHREDQCVSVGSTLHKVVPLKSGFVGVVSYGREICSVPSFIQVAASASHSFILTVTGATVGGTVVILVLVFGVMMTARVCSRKKGAKQDETSATYQRADGLDQRGDARTVDEDGLIYISVSHEETSSNQQATPIRTEDQTIYSSVRIEDNGIRVDENKLVYFSVAHSHRPDSSDVHELVQPEETTIYSNVNGNKTPVSAMEDHEDDVRKTDVVAELYATPFKENKA
ncbi:uncharacterized protein [Diadema antillarum]|uniref:uncharacterized protein n=2 Tax=Diadema antillarum TaxID=105358 RepID=UPI003A8504B4